MNERVPPIEEHDLLDKLVTESQKAQVLVSIGFPDMLTPDNFPTLNKENPELLGLYKLSAYRNYLGQLQNARILVRGDKDASAGISRRMALVSKLISAEAKIYFPGGSEDVLPNYFFMSSDEDTCLRVAINLGFPEAITIENLPSLSGISQENRDRLILEAHIAKLKCLKAIAEELNQGSLGFSGGGRESNFPYLDIQSAIQAEKGIITELYIRCFGKSTLAKSE